MDKLSVTLLHLALLIIAGTSTLAERYCDAKEGDCSREQDATDEQFISPDVDVAAILKELRSGEKGFVVVPAVFPPEEIAEARERILALIDSQGEKATHFQGSDDEEEEDDSKKLSSRVWNLLNKGKIFGHLVNHPIFTDIASKFLGEDFQLGSVASNTIFPGGSGQEPHIDYPYWDYFKSENWPAEPKHKDIPFFMNLQATIMLDDFTAENGATAVRPGTQVKSEYPWDSEDFHRHMVQAEGKAGDVMFFPGLLQHCAMPNRAAEGSRTGVLIQMLPKFVRPMEDLKSSIAPEVVQGLPKNVKRMLLLDYPYPAVMDKEVAQNREGVNSKD